MRLGAAHLSVIMSGDQSRSGARECNDSGLDSCAARQTRHIEELLGIPDPLDRLAHVIDRVRRRPRLDARFRTEAFEVPGCTSRVWLVAIVDRAGRCRIQAEAESPALHGLVTLVCDIYDGGSPDEIRRTPFTVLESAGLVRHLTSNRQEGLARFVAHVQGAAVTASDVSDRETSASS